MAFIGPTTLIEAIHAVQLSYNYKIKQPSHFSNYLYGCHLLSCIPKAKIFPKTKKCLILILTVGAPNNGSGGCWNFPLSTQSTLIWPLSFFGFC